MDTSKDISETREPQKSVPTKDETAPGAATKTPKSVAATTTAATKAKTTTTLTKVFLQRHHKKNFARKFFV